MLTNELVFITAVDTKEGQKYIVSCNGKNKELTAVPTGTREGGWALKHNNVHVRCKDGFVYTSGGYIHMAEIVLAQMMAAVVMEQFPNLKG